MTLFLNVASAVLIVAAVCVALACARKVRRIHGRAIQLDRISAELKRALEQLDSGEKSEIWLGLHTIARIDDDEVASVVLPKLKELGASNDAQIARQARRTVQRVERRMRRGAA